MKDSSVQFCPVPTEQQPVCEYEQLKESWFFRWATLDHAAYWRKLAWLGMGGWIIIAPIAAASFSPKKHLFLFLVSSGWATAILMGLVLLRLYLGWYYVSDRLKAEKVFYEESGWYDGQIWQKPPEMLARDRLIVSYQLDPILNRLQRTGIILAILVGSGSLLWLWL